MAATSVSTFNWHRLRGIDRILTDTVNRIAATETKNAPLLATYELEYFYGMHLHLSSLPNGLAPGAELHYIVGNSMFFGNIAFGRIHPGAEQPAPRMSLWNS